MEIKNSILKIREKLAKSEKSRPVSIVTQADWYRDNQDYSSSVSNAQVLSIPVVASPSSSPSNLPSPGPSNIPSAPSANPTTFPSQNPKAPTKSPVNNPSNFQIKM